MGEVDIAVGRLRQFAAGLGVDETTLRLIALMVWTGSVKDCLKSDGKAATNVRATVES